MNWDPHLELKDGITLLLNKRRSGKHSCRAITLRFILDNIDLFLMLKEPIIWDPSNSILILFMF